MQQQIITDALRLQAFGWGVRDLAHQCFTASMASVLACMHHRVPCLLFAGTMNWRFMDPSVDDGASDTHYSYVWSPQDPRSGANYLALRQLVSRPTLPEASGALPEVHVWVSLPSVNLNAVLDLTTGHFPEHASRLGFRWTAARPPQHFWGVPDDVDQRYEPSQEATSLLSQLAVKMIIKAQGIDVARAFCSHIMASADFAQKLRASQPSGLCSA